MLCLPAFVLALVRSYTKCKALFTEKNVSAVSRVNGNNCIVLWELANPSLFGIHIAFAMKSANPVIAVTENVKNLLADSGHN